MSIDPFQRIIDNNANILEQEQEGSVKDIFAYHVNEAESEEDSQFRMDIGTGYLFFSGFKETYDLFKKLLDKSLLDNITEENWGSKAPIRVVMGPETTGFTKEVLKSIVKDDICIYSDECIDLLKEMVEKNLIDFRVFLERKFHPKIYNFYLRSSIPDDIWSGSANFTKGGLTDNIELCTPMYVTSQSRKLFRDWFDALWKKSTPELDVLNVIDEVKESDYIYYHPRIFFTKLIKLLDKEYLLEEGEKWTNEILLEFQNLSYYIVMERLQKYGGYILANSVGLGKSYVACQAMRSYLKQNPGKKCLVITSPRLMTDEEWGGYLREFGISDRVDLESIGRLHKTPYEDREGDEYYFDHRKFAEEYSLIVVDEIHHYRNTSNRRKNLENIISSNPEADCLFLSATPVNLGSEDLFNLIDLFYRGNNVSKFENQGMRELYDKTRSEVKNLRDENLTKDILNRIKEIEKELSLKISWRIIQEHFEEDLKKLSGVEAKYEEPETKEVSFTYPESYKKEIFDKIVPFLKKLNYEPAKLWDGQGYKDDKNLTFWYIWQLYKRLESSLYAFYKSIHNLRDRFFVYKTALDREEMLSEESIGLLPDISKTRYKEVVDEERLRVVVETFKSLDSNLKTKVVERLNEDLNTTDDMLKKLENEFGEREVTPYPEDNKLDELKTRLRENMESNAPTIVFSEFKDTINYLYESLKNDFEKIDFIHGDTKKSKSNIMDKFQEGEINIILATGVLSEGVNLPRADSIINFDLPYNPTTLVQRVGRALRISNPKKIYVYNFKPEEDIDKELELYEKLEVRLRTILSIVGLDFVVWMMDEKEIQELHEEEMDEYIKNYGEYKEKVSNTNPDDLVSETMPEESKLDRVIRKSINKFNISQDLVENISKEARKPAYTVLEDDEKGFFAVTGIGKKNKLIKEISESLEPVKTPELKKITESEKSQLEELVNRTREEIILERTSRRDLTRDTEQLIEKIMECKQKFHNAEMKDTLESIRDILSKDGYRPEEKEEVKEGIDEILNYPDIFKEHEFDKQINKRDFWKRLEELSQKSITEEEVKLKAFIKYTNEGQT